MVAYSSEHTRVKQDNEAWVVDGFQRRRKLALESDARRLSIIALRTYSVWMHSRAVINQVFFLRIFGSTPVYHNLSPVDESRNKYARPGLEKMVH